MYPEYAYPDLEGTAVFTRPCEARFTHAMAMKDIYGTRIVAELDDNHLASGKTNLAIRYWEGDVAGAHLNTLRHVDAVIFSTEWLRDHYTKEYRKRLGLKPRDLPEFHVCGNHLDPDDWPERSPMREDGRLRIGWMGSASHLWDLKHVYPALLAAYRLGHEVVIIGFDPKWRPDDEATGVRTHTGQRVLVRPQYPIEYTHIPWVDPTDYGRPKVGLPLDIALAPLRRDEFNLGRSDVKFIEYSISGAATIASPSVYGRTIQHGETGLLAESREEFEQQMLALIRDGALRSSLSENAAQYVREDRLLTNPVHHAEWSEAVLG